MPVTRDVRSVLEVTKLLSFRFDTMQAAMPNSAAHSQHSIQAKRIATHLWQ